MWGSGGIYGSTYQLVLLVLPIESIELADGGSFIEMSLLLEVACCEMTGIVECFLEDSN